jgi:hypothetical protein
MIFLILVLVPATASLLIGTGILVCPAIVLAKRKREWRKLIHGCERTAES